MKKALCFVLLLSMVALFALAGCGAAQNGGTGTSAAAEATTAAAAQTTAAAADGGVKTLTCLVNPQKTVEDVTTNNFTKWLEEQTKVHLDFTVIAGTGDDVTQKVNLMFNSGEKLPDITLVGLTTDNQLLYGSQGILIPLNDLIEKKRPEYPESV